MFTPGDVLEREIRIAARPETVYAFFTEADKMAQWKGLRAWLDPRPGGEYRVDINGRDVARGAYVELVPHRRLVFTWGWEGGPLPPGASTVEVTLTPDDSGTLVRLRHHGLPSEDAYNLHAGGWDHYLPRLAQASVGNDPGPDPRSGLDTKHAG